MGFKCIKLQKPPRVHSLKENSRGTVRNPSSTLSAYTFYLSPLILNAVNYKHDLLTVPHFQEKIPKRWQKSRGSQQVLHITVTCFLPALSYTKCTPRPPPCCANSSQAAKARAGPALPHLVLAAAGLSEVSDRRELGMDGLPVEPAIVQVDHGLFCIFFTAKLKAKSTFSLQYRQAT